MKFTTFIILTILLASSALTRTTRVFAREKEAESAAVLVAYVQTVDPRIEKLASFLSSHRSPLAPDAASFVNEADRWGVDWQLVAAIAGVESTFGKHIPAHSFNAWGWGVFTGTQDGVHFQDWRDGISKVTAGLRTNYMNRGLLTVEQIGRMYAASPTWARKVGFFVDQIDTFTPSDSRRIEITI